MNITENILSFVRRQSLRGKEKDSSLTGILPLGEIRSVVVIFDADIPGSVQLISRIHEFFAPRGIKVSVFAVAFGIQLISEGMQKAVYVHRDDVNWYGRIKSGRSHPHTDVGEDLFISLYGEDTFISEYAARCSKARFKVGRKPLSRDVYDLVINDSQGKPFSQYQAFEAIADFLSKIQY